MKCLFLIAMAIALLGAACGFQPATQTPISMGTTTPTLTATPAAATGMPTIARTATPTATKPNTWKLFSSREHGFEFRYPEACGVAELDDSLNVGGRIELAILRSEGMSLSDYVNRFTAGKSKNGDWTVESIKSAFLGGQQALVVDYRFGGPGRFGTATFTLRNGKVYIWALTSGGLTCDEPNVYGPILSSFRFTQ